LLNHFHKVAWLNPMPEAHWTYTHSTGADPAIVCGPDVSDDAVRPGSGNASVDALTKIASMDGLYACLLRDFGTRLGSSAMSCASNALSVMADEPQGA
jgi:hypothetical protein